MIKEGKITKAIRKNPYKLATIILFLIVLILISDGLMESKAKSEWENTVCAEMPRYSIGTPGWFDSNGKLVNVGAILTNDSEPKIDLVNERLIPDRIHFVYSDTCSWCKKQIEYFGENWKVYQDKGLTIKCR